MSDALIYQEAARVYTDGVRALFASGGAPVKERGVRGPASYDEVVEQAEKLLPASVNLTEAAARQLTEEEPAARSAAATRLLAKALTDLQISAYLLHKAAEEDNNLSWPKAEVGERGLTQLSLLPEELNILTGNVDAGYRGMVRGPGPAGDLAEARQSLARAIADILSQIFERAGRTGQTALEGLGGLGFAELGQAAGLLTSNLAQYLGQGEKISRLYNLFRSFLGQVYDSLIALIGQPLMQTVIDKVMEWLKEVKQGEVFSEMLENFYQTNPTNKELGLLVDQSQAALDKFVVATREVESLSDDYGQQIKLVDKLLGWLKFLGGAAASVLPMGQLLVAAAYIALGGYAVLAGADYVDAPRLRLLDRIPGVRRVVEENLV